MSISNFVLNLEQKVFYTSLGAAEKKINNKVSSLKTVDFPVFFNFVFDLR